MPKHKGKVRIRLKISFPFLKFFKHIIRIKEFWIFVLKGTIFLL